MDQTISKMNKDASNLLESLFYNKLIKLETDVKKELPAFSKQVEIAKNRDEVIHFIEHNPHSMFDVRVLHKNTEDKEDFKVSLLFKNYDVESDKRPHRFMIVIDSAFNNVSYYEWSLNNILLPL